MRRKNEIKKEVLGPQTGLVTRFPTDLTGQAADQALSDASNVRAQDGSLSNAPGYERVVIDGDPLDSEPLRIWQANILSVSRDTRRSVLVGTGSTTYEMKRRAVEIDCSGTCALRFAFIADAGKWWDPADEVAQLVRSWGPDMVLHGGDVVYSSGYSEQGGVPPGASPYEDLLARYYAWAIGGYDGVHGQGPSLNRLFAVPGNHDLTDFPFQWWREFFDLPSNEAYYSIKWGPCHFIMLNSNESSLYSGFDGYDDITAGSAQELWASNLIANSDCPWVIPVGHAPPHTSGLSHTPGSPDIQWLDNRNFSVGLFGHAHNYERLQVNGKDYLVMGASGHSIRGFGTPVTGSLFRDSSGYGAILVEADAETLTAKFYHRDGTLIDTYTNTTPLRSLTQCYTYKQATTLEIVPDSGACAVSQSFQFRAVVTYTDGSKEDVTAASGTTWAASDPAIALIADGRAVGQQIGVTPITATFSGLTANAQLQVFEQCVDTPRDWLFCIERSASMGRQADGRSVLNWVADAAQSMTRNLATTDQSCLVSFAGDYDTQANDAGIDQPLTFDHSAVAADFNTLRPFGDCDIAGGLDLAYSEILERRQSVADDARAIVVLVVDGPARVTDPGGDGTVATAMAAAKVAADRIKALEKTSIVVLAYNIATTDNKAEVLDLATPGYAWDITTVTELHTTLQMLPHLICEYGENPYSYGYGCVSPVLDYFDFINWDVTNGVVDLCGEGTNGVQLFNEFPGNGLYVDMVGTVAGSALGNKQYNGHMTSKVGYDFVSGKTYKFSIDVSGTGRSANKFPMSIRVKIGSLFEKLATKGPKTQDETFRTFAWEFEGDGGTHAIELIMERETNDPASTVGIFIDNIVLTNLTDTIIMLQDNFDGENACPP